MEYQNLAIAHWGEHCNGGAERVAWEIQRTFEAPLWVGHRDPTIEPDDVNDVRGLFHGRLSNAAIRFGGLARAASYFANWNWNGNTLRNLKDYDILITSGNETLFYCGPDTQTHVHYVHHTSRRHTDLLHWWPNNLKGLLGRGYAWLIRQLMNNPTNRPDLYVANSEVIARRVHKYWGIPYEKIRVVYPPIDTQIYGDHLAETQDYYLYLGRLDDWHKHISLLIETLNNTCVTLKIAGTGPDEQMLKEMASDNIEFTGYVSEERKREMLSEAKAFLFAAEEEDFGIATAEALASGTPVIGPEEGFTQYQIRPGKAGLLFDRNDPQTLRDAIAKIEAKGLEWTSVKIEAHAENFSIESFRKGMQAVVEEALERTQVSVEWDKSCPKRVSFRGENEDEVRVLPDGGYE